MTKNEQVANIMCFLSILFENNLEAWEKVMDFPPEYIIEKFERYILSSRVEYSWGLHPILRNNRFFLYLDKWNLEMDL